MGAEDERNKLFHSKVVSVICTILLSASDKATSAKPFFPINTVLAAINHIPNQKDAQKNKDLLWGQASVPATAMLPFFFALKAQASLPSEQLCCCQAVLGANGSIGSAVLDAAERHKLKV